MAEPYGTIAKYRNALAIKKHNAIIQPWASAMALDVAAVFWATWKGIEERLPEGDEILEAEKPRDSRDLKNKYSAIIRVEVKRHSAELQRVIENYIYRVWLAGAVEQCRDLGCTGWFFSSLSKSSTSSESASAPDGASLQEAPRVRNVKADKSGWVSLPNLRAQEYAKKHAAEAVTQINDTTRKEIARIVSDGVKSGSSYNDIAKAIKDKFEEFAVPMPQKHVSNRAVLVAVTELANAYCEGNAQVGNYLQDNGVKMMKAWQTLEDDRVSDGCKENERVGWIPINKEFPSGHMHPPRFPGCRCDFLQDILEEDMLGKPIDAIYGEQYTAKGAQIPEEHAFDDTSKIKYTSSKEMFSEFKKKYSSELSELVKESLKRVFKDMENDPDGWGITYREDKGPFLPKLDSLISYGNMFPDDDYPADKWSAMLRGVKDGKIDRKEAGRMLLLDMYCGTGRYSVINTYLRGGKLKKSEENALPGKDVIQFVIDAMKTEELTRGFTATRYLRDTPKKFVKSLKVDSTYTDKGFISLTTKDEQGFSRDADVIMHIYVPPGKGRGVYAQALESIYPSNYRLPAKGFTDEDSQGEHEFVLTPGSRFKVTKVEDNNGIKEAWLEVYDE